MDFLTDLSLNAEWGLDFLDQPNGLFGDLKPSSRLVGDMDPALKPRDAVEQLTYSPVSEAPLDDWMESGDLGSFLDSLDNNTMLPLGDGLFDCSQELSLKDSVTHTQSLAFAPSFEGNGEFINSLQGLTPPDSPEQVTPVIKLDPEFSDGQLISIVSPQDISLHALIKSEVNPELTFVDYTSPTLFLNEQLDTTPELIEESEIFSLPFTSAIGNVSEQVLSTVDHSSSDSSDDGDSVLSLSEASSSPKPNIESLIQSSPELYKVIATPSSARFSPYTKIKGEQKELKTRKSKKGKLSLEIDPEETFSNHPGKKERKKLQNKNAAIRYRQKKKAEVEGIVSEVQGLEDKNNDLKSKVEDLNREIKYMKNLMEEIYKAKGLVK